MEASVMTARAIERARSQKIRINKTKRPGVYWAWSHSEPSKKYVLVRTPHGVVCSCRSYYYRRDCKHKQALLQRLARTGEQETFNE